MDISAVTNAIAQTEEACGVLRALITRAVSTDDKSYIVTRETIPLKFAVSWGQLIAAFPCTVHTLHPLTKFDAVRYCAQMTEEGQRGMEVESYVVWLLRTLQEMNEMTALLKKMVD